MRISINNVWLTNDGTVDLPSWTDAHGVQLNGRQIVQDAQFLRAVAAQPLARGNLVNQLRFTVTRQHASVAAAAAFVLTAFGTLPGDGTATLVCGALGESGAITCTFNAVLEEMPESTFHGTRSDTVYVLRGGAITALSTGTATVDGATFLSTYTYAAGGSVDGGNLADALMPAGLDLDAGGWA